jgi:predicted Fe-Mo cluster-binding NifX family protein
MKAAIPIVGTCVSPRFDCGAALLVAEIDGGVVTSRQEVVDTASNALQRVARLRELGVEVLVCGAVTGFLLRHLAANAIRVFPLVSGEASDVLDSLARGRPPLAAVPALRCGRGWRARGCGRGGPHGHRELGKPGNSK